ncbi:MarR family transcriptional regulator [Microbacterium sp. SORGH_AS_0888]|uniref:MarR family transcriptional regulator n=1 Tax=Microbacterium sp. SORGH_AS_0888 TaxID=3041791 RepID=UPI002785143E|nr:MarR family transcriptional regulator [Microbacterium sp. SORGH_AS_0888]MDQ1129457.1 DNA-binding MarR family transcriptional regulator [Microbacterium sp. SORGH_AS_0888]
MNGTKGGRMVLGDEATDAVALRMATFRLARRLRLQRGLDDMSDAQFAVLALLRRHGPHTPGELAELERVSAPSMNRTVNCLEESGFVARSPDETDRRKVNVTITDVGRLLVEETQRRRDAWLEGALDDLSDDERATLMAAVPLLRRVADR